MLAVGLKHGDNVAAESFAALAKAVCDRKYLVRYHAANTLLHYARPAKAFDRVSQRPELFTLIASDDPRSWAEAVGLLT